MAYYQYYQSGGPWQSAWGTNAYQFQPPPMPSYIPQQGWTGVDYYNAHSGYQDSSFFDYVFGKLRNVFTGVSVSRGEAEHWHRRVYGGLVQLTQLLPREIGAAAGWETVRLWQTHQAFYAAPFTGDHEREREALIGLAIAEVAKLWQYVNRPYDKYGRREAGQVAAATASRIFSQMYEYDNPYEPYRSGRFADQYSDAGDYMDYQGRRGSFSGYGGSSYGSVSPYSAASPIPVPSANISTPYLTNPYGGLGAQASPYGTLMSTSPYAQSQFLSPYAQSYVPTTPSTIVIDSNGGHRHRHRSSSGHRHRHRHHHRAKSSSGVSYYEPAYSSASYS